MWQWCAALALPPCLMVSTSCCALLSCSISILLYSVEVCIMCFFRAHSVVWILSIGPTCYQFSKLCESLTWAGYELCTSGILRSWAHACSLAFCTALVSGSVIHRRVHFLLSLAALALLHRKKTTQQNPNELDGVVTAQVIEGQQMGFVREAAGAPQEIWSQFMVSVWVHLASCSAL